MTPPRRAGTRSGRKDDATVGTTPSYHLARQCLVVSVIADLLDVLEHEQPDTASEAIGTIAREHGRALAHLRHLLDGWEGA